MAGPEPLQTPHQRLPEGSPDLTRVYVRTMRVRPRPVVDVSVRPTSCVLS
jgi:hypothetical protein